MIKKIKNSYKFKYIKIINKIINRNLLKKKIYINLKTKNLKIYFQKFKI